MTTRLSRRSLFSGALIVAPASRFLEHWPFVIGQKSRIETATELRQRLAVLQGKRPMSSMATNHDEEALPNRIACFSKGLSKNDNGEVQLAAYNGLLAAIQSGRYPDFERIPRGGGRKLSNPQAAYSFHLEGGDPHTFEIAVPPSVMSEVLAAEASELYWQALARDITFANFRESSLIGLASKRLGVSPQTVFRGLTENNAKGPYVSQFLLKPIPYGSAKINQFFSVPTPGSDFLTTIGEWSQIQTGIPPWREATYDSAPRYIRNGRDLAEYVHYDHPYQAFLNAALILYNA